MADNPTPLPQNQPVVLQVIEQKAAEPTPNLSVTEPGGKFILNGQEIDAHGQPFGSEKPTFTDPYAEIQRLNREKEQEQAQAKRAQEQAQLHAASLLDFQAELRRQQRQFDAARRDFEAEIERLKTPPSVELAAEPASPVPVTAVAPPVEPPSAPVVPAVTTSTSTPVTAEELTQVLGDAKKALALLNAGFGTREKLVAASDGEFGAIEGIGPASVTKIREFLAA